MQNQSDVRLVGDNDIIPSKSYTVENNLGTYWTGRRFDLSKHKSRKLQTKYLMDSQFVSEKLLPRHSGCRRRVSPRRSTGNTGFVEKHRERERERENNLLQQ